MINNSLMIYSWMSTDIDNGRCFVSSAIVKLIVALNALRCSQIRVKKKFHLSRTNHLHTTIVHIKYKNSFLLNLVLVLHSHILTLTSVISATKRI